MSSKLIEDAKRNYFLKAGNALANPGTSRKRYWSLINTVLNKAKIPTIPPILENGLFITDFTEKAQLFNDYFILQCTTIDTDSEIPTSFPAPPSLINDFPITDEKILNIIRSLNPNKAHGWDGISVRMIKLSDAALVIPLKIIFENCLRCGLFPKIWKYANVVPVHKKNEKNLKGNYRPISLLPIFGKILEKLMYDSLYSHLVSCNLLNPNQSGFRPGDSTINQLISITHTIFEAFDCNPPLDVRSVYLDISKAFDRVWHDGLIYKLKRCGVSGELLPLIQSFLKDRKQRTVLNGQNSNWGDISAGVPQGSILGPLFFLVYINDLAAEVKCKVKLFADDTSLFTVVEDLNSAAIPSVKRKPRCFVLHIGANDFRDEEDDNEIAKTIFGLAKTLKADENTVYVSGIIKRDDDKMNARISNVNKVLKELCGEADFPFIDNSNIEVGHHLNRSGLHLNRFGDAKLAFNIISALRN